MSRSRPLSIRSIASLLDRAGLLRRKNVRMAARPAQLSSTVIPPTAQELKALQDACEGEMNMMRHCRQCRADAVGLLGEDRSAEFTTDKIMAMEVNYDLDTRKAYQAKVEEERVAKVAAKQEELSTLVRKRCKPQLVVAEYLQPPATTAQRPFEIG